MKLLNCLLIISMIAFMACTSDSHCDKMCLSQRFVEDNFMQTIFDDDFILFTFYESGICHRCYRVPMYTVYVTICNQYSDKIIYLITDSDTTINRLSAYQFHNVHFLVDKHRKQDVYGIDKEIPEVMVFSNRKLTNLFLVDRK